MLDRVTIANSCVSNPASLKAWFHSFGNPFKPNSEFLSLIIVTFLCNYYGFPITGLKPLISSILK